MLENEPIIRLSVFTGMLVLMILLESLFPRRERRFGRLTRWPANLVILLIDTLAVRLLFPFAAVGFALMCEQRGLGILNALDPPAPISIAAGMILLDLTIYMQHVVFHRVNWFWRFHRMHHTDLDLDVTSGTRFHPVEIILSMLIKLAAIWILGAPAVAVLLFEVLLNAGAMFNHANLRLPAVLDRTLRLFIVTPDMHRIHHSIAAEETDRNFGFNLSCWDRLFGTYKENPDAGQVDMTLGLPGLQDPEVQRIDRMLLQPWRKADEIAPPD